MPLWNTKRPQHHTIDIADASARMRHAADTLRFTALKARHVTSKARLFQERAEAQIAQNQGAA
ncbi:hypothetical protein [Streptomyces sp. NPDC091027]|uniref:hypothetical protein n=1 Tax=Streptomyces sp. NPDC091027 TaxID=3365971 RepID=UPI00382E04E0